jgi:hypothetical protein
MGREIGRGRDRDEERDRKGDVYWYWRDESIEQISSL